MITTITTYRVVVRRPEGFPDTALGNYENDYRRALLAVLDYAEGLDPMIPAGENRWAVSLHGRTDYIVIESHDEKVCHCGALARNDDSDYAEVCNQWPLCEGGLQK